MWICVLAFTLVLIGTTIGIMIAIGDSRWDANGAGLDAWADTQTSLRDLTSTVAVQKMMIYSFVDSMRHVTTNQGITINAFQGSVRTSLLAQNTTASIAVAGILDLIAQRITDVKATITSEHQYMVNRINTLNATQVAHWG